MSTFFALLAFFVLAPPQDFKAYQNYDFVPGDTVVFEDDLDVPDFMK